MICPVTDLSYPSGKHVRAMYTPREPHFYLVKLGFAEVYLFFLFLLQNIDCGYSLEPPRQGGSNVYPQSMFRAKIRKLSNKILTKFSIFDTEKNSVYLAWASFHNDSEDRICLVADFSYRRDLINDNGAAFYSDTRSKWLS